MLNGLVSGAVVVVLLTQFSTPSRGGGCSYDSCTKGKDGMINVHMVPHSHDDVGWLKTVDQYFLGSNRRGWDNNEAHRGGVQYTLDTAIIELATSPNRRFIQVETAFFWRWWREQEQDVQDMVKQLINTGQLEFVGAGWSMNDEAATHYSAIIDQMTLGLDLLNQTFGECGRPRVAWQIDPFGHSREQGRLFADMGFDGLFVTRVDFRDRERRTEAREMEMIWSTGTSGEHDMFTGILYDMYNPPRGFCWDITCNDSPIMNNPVLEDSNLEERVATFVAYVKSQATHYRTNHIVMTMGEDFMYQAAHTWFLNMDRLMENVNSRQGEEDFGINVFYSTPSCYLKALHDSNLTWPTKSDDFFPYASDPHAFWTGYFTSRPTSKRMMRQAELYLKTLQQISVLENPPRDAIRQLDHLMEAVGVVQHHDAITGTEKQVVADNYHQRLHEALGKSLAGLGMRPVYEGNETDLTGIFVCPMLNISQCAVTEKFNSASSDLFFSVYNPLAHIRSVHVRLPVSQMEGLGIVDELGEVLVSQIVPLPEGVVTIPGRNSNAVADLVFHAVDLPPLGVKQFRLVQTARESDKYHNHSQGSWLIVEENRINMVDTIRNVATQVKFEYMYYDGFRGNNSSPDLRASGAYIFRPKDSQSVHRLSPVSSINYDGPVVNEIHLGFEGGWVSLVVRQYAGEDHVEVEWLVGPVPVEDGVGKEVILRYSADISNTGEFFTDSNGRQLMRRVRDYQPTFETGDTEPVSQNYYPVTSKLLIRDPANELAVLNDRAQGGGSIVDGSVELMLHRRLLDDDGFGVREALNEVAYGVGLVARGKHWLLANSNLTLATEQHRFLAMEMFYEPLLVFTDVEFQGVELAASLPLSLHILSLERLHRREDIDTFILLRLEHFFQVEEHPVYSAPVTIDMTAMFKGLSVESVEEVGLAANLRRDEISRLIFTPEAGSADRKAAATELEASAVVINPMEIRTFILKVIYD